MALRPVHRSVERHHHAGRAPAGHAADGVCHGPPGPGLALRHIMRALALGALVALWLMAASLAAAVTTIPGDSAQRNMTIHVADHGSVQAVVPGVTPGGMFFPPSSDSAWNYFYLRVKSGPHADTTFSTLKSAQVTPVSNGPTTGNWTPNSPAQVTTVYDLGPSGGPAVARVTQTTLYVAYSRSFNIIWEVRNLTAEPLNFIAGTAADLYINGDDNGTGLFIDGPNRFVGGTNAASRKVGGLREVTLSRNPATEPNNTPVARWASYQEAGYSFILDRLVDFDSFENTIVEGRIDNGVGATWEDHLTDPVPPGQSARYEVQWVANQPLPLTASPAQATRELPGEHDVVLTMVDGQTRAPVPNMPIYWRVDGVNATPSDPAHHNRAVTNAAGQVVITIRGTDPGQDTVVAWADVLGAENGVRESAEPQTSATVHWLADNRMDGAPTVPDGLNGPGGNLPVERIDDPSNPETPTYAFSPAAAERAGFPSCEFNNRTGRELNLPLSVTLEPGAGTIDSAELLVVNPGSQDPNSDDPDLRPATIASSSVDGNTQHFTVGCVTSAELWLRYTLTEGADSQTFVIPIGGLLLIDPQGVVHDRAAYDQAIAAGRTPDEARAGSAITGATVRLQRRDADGQFVNVLSGDPGITPNINPQITRANGLFQWDVAEGTYRVVVEAPGFVTHTSRAVDIPPPVLDLHIPMEREGATDPTPPVDETPAPPGTPAGPAPTPVVPTPGTPVAPAPPATAAPKRALPPALKVARPTVARTLLNRGTRVRLRVRATLPTAARGRQAIIQRRQGTRWVAMAKVKVPANRRINRTITLARRTLGSGRQLQVRIMLPRTPKARASVGKVRKVALPPLRPAPVRTAPAGRGR